MLGENICETINHYWKMVKVIIIRHFSYNYNQNRLFSMANSVIPNYPQTTQMINFLLDGKHTFIVSEKSQSNNNQKRKKNIIWCLTSFSFYNHTSFSFKHHFYPTPPVPLVYRTHFSPEFNVKKVCWDIFQYFHFFCRRRGLPID